MSIVNFTCPECKNNEIEEILINVTQTSVINTIDECGDIKYGNILNEDGEINRFQCVACGYILIDENECQITCQIELAEYLKRINEK
ncbi:hypothetical protein LCGC14_2587110 [marine sediment metagenome]|uniref:Uncharacterized protein n=1 Tax=marine sediment metagenome TaxID=412755 RepID=A0A0F9AD52_9ZZZZ